MKIKLIIVLILLSARIFGQSGGIFNNGTTIHVGEKGDKTPVLHVKGDICIEKDGSIAQEGTTLLTGNFVNNVTSSNVFTKSSSGTVEFIGTEKQYITGEANKAANYIDFPNIRIFNPASVELNAKMGMSVNNLDLDQGLFILDSEVREDDNAYVDNAHLMLKGDITYNIDESDPSDNGAIQVNLELGDNYQNRRIVGFTSPFKKMYADYFMYNMVWRPEAGDLTGNTGATIKDPAMSMEAGVGYVVGQGIVDISDSYWNDIRTAYPGADPADRATENFTFGRSGRTDSYLQYATASDKFTGEELVTENVTLPLTPGWNYFGNPFTVPLDITSFITNEDVADEWGVTRSSYYTADLHASVYILSGGIGQSMFPFPNPILNASYLVAQKVGGTVELKEDKVGGALIRSGQITLAPMQMFSVRSYTNVTGKNITIPASKRTHGDMPYIKSKSTEELPVDEIMIQVKDNDTEGFDRLAVVFRDDASLEFGDAYDAEKLFNTTKGVSQIYTKASNAYDLTTNVISPETESLDMYLIPSLQEQEVTLTTHRLASLRSVNQVVLEDKVTGVKTDLVNNPAYTFLSSPSDREDRFKLHFVSQDNLSDKLKVYYTSGILTIAGLSESDMNSTIRVNDMLGRLIYQGKVNTIPEMMIPMGLETGAYIVNISGEKPYTQKIIVK